MLHNLIITQCVKCVAIELLAYNQQEDTSDTRRRYILLMSAKQPPKANTLSFRNHQMIKSIAT